MSVNVPIINNNVFFYHIQFSALAVVRTTYHIWEETFSFPNRKLTSFLFIIPFLSWWTRAPVSFASFATLQILLALVVISSKKAHKTSSALLHVFPSFWSVILWTPELVLPPPQGGLVLGNAAPGHRALGEDSARVTPSRALVLGKRRLGWRILVFRTIWVSEPAQRPGMKHRARMGAWKQSTTKAELSQCDFRLI